MKKRTEAMFTSKQDDWETPDGLFDKLNQEFHFTVDVASSDENAKCEKHYTIVQDGLAQSWKGETAWCNPPYGRVIERWVKKAYEETFNGCTTVMLLPSRTSNNWFHEYALPYAEIRFIKGRVKFLMGGVQGGQSTFPSVILIFRRKEQNLDFERRTRMKITVTIKRGDADAEQKVFATEKLAMAYALMKVQEGADGFTMQYERGNE